MATIRKGRTTVKVLGLLGILLIAALVLAGASPVMAKTEKVTYRNVNQMTKIHVIKVGDVPGHIIAVFERRGLGLFDGEVAVYHGTQMLDSTKGKGTLQGYIMYTFEDGSTMVSKVEGNVTPLKDKRISSKGTFTYIGGTGRFEGIKGSGTWSARSYTPNTKDETKSDVIVDITGTRTLPDK